ncbi:uncharacterized protein PAC_11818 [Phialocephala subalpina]|uniref:Uncharacterized protein n=1 Tax=Phialocephala subalpina TaxID=576137 RepID=A0A1L7XA69_9HELO|nr:uncharacterized protein PAC_11818 [Phialocephala subalpina]
MEYVERALDAAAQKISRPFFAKSKEKVVLERQSRFRKHFALYLTDPSLSHNASSMLALAMYQARFPLKSGATNWDLAVRVIFHLVWSVALFVAFKGGHDIARDWKMNRLARQIRGECLFAELEKDAIGRDRLTELIGKLLREEGKNEIADEERERIIKGSIFKEEPFWKWNTVHQWPQSRKYKEVLV